MNIEDLKGALESLSEDNPALALELAAHIVQDVSDIYDLEPLTIIAVQIETESRKLK